MLEAPKETEKKPANDFTVRLAEMISQPGSVKIYDERKCNKSNVVLWES